MFNFLTTLLALLAFAGSTSAQQPSQPTNTQTASSQWAHYPDSLPRFDFSGDKLKAQWPLLAAGTGLPWPDEMYFQEMVKRYPKLIDYVLEHENLNTIHPALLAAEHGDYSQLAVEVQQVWRLHFQGQFQQAYELGMTLGPAGYVPALYSKLIYTTLLVDSNEVKQQQFLEVQELAESLLPVAADYSFLVFGSSYAKARRLEIMSTTEAGASGLLSPTKETLESLYEQFPDSVLYPAMLGGIHAGIIDRVGGFVGSLTYGASEEDANNMFTLVLEKESRLPVLYNEYAKALSRIDLDDNIKRIKQLYEQCSLLEVYSAEEALNQEECIQQISVL